MTLSAPSFLAASTSLSMPPRSAADFAVAAEPAGFSSLGGFDGEPQPVAAASNRVTPATDVMAVDRNLRTDVLLGWYGVARVLRVVGARLPSSGQLDHDMLDLGVFLERVDRPFLAVSRLLGAAPRHLRGHRAVVVDPDGAEAQPPRRLHGPADVAGEHRRPEPVPDIVREREGRLVVLDRLHGDDRAEHLALHDLAVLLDVGYHGRRDEESRTRQRAAAGEERAAVGLRPVQEPE